MMISRTATNRRAFTLTELVVAVGVVAILTVAIGQIFRSISGLTRAGIAVAEVDQIARAVERQLRDDFEALARTPSSETFIAIRMREVGDVNRNGALEPTEIPLYLTRADFEADRREGVAPYSDGSRAITTRLDEIMFLARSPRASYPSFQRDAIGRTAAAADAARIYYGHALRPRPDPTWPPEDYNPTNPQTWSFPVRQLYPDGDFGQGPYFINADDDTYTQQFDTTVIDGGPGLFDPTGRNQFAGSWVLARQPLLLYGGDAAGYRNSRPIDRDPIGESRTFAPFIRDLETAVWAAIDAPLFGPGAPNDQGDFNDDEQRPNPRYIAQGRTDICAQSLSDVIRWFEGAPPPGAFGQVGSTIPPDALDNAAPPFSSGLFAVQSGAGLPSTYPSQYPFLNRHLWQRYEANGSVGPQGDPRLSNLAAVRSAIAGSFTRLLAEPVPPPVNRRQVGRTAGVLPESPEKALMDLHAVLAAQCSRFEIAWSDGTTATRPIDLDGDGFPEVGYGDVIWFDVTPVTDDPFPNRSSRAFWTTSWNGSINATQDTQYGEVEDLFGAFGALSLPPGSVQLLNVAPLGSGANPAQVGAYSPDFTLGDPNGDEALAIFPMRNPTAGGEYGGAFAKPKLIRITITLHDSQFRLPEGRTYQFVLPVRFADQG